MSWEDTIRKEVMGERNRRTNKRLFSANQILIDAVEDDLRGHKGTKEALGKLIRSMEKKHPVKVTNTRFFKGLRDKTFMETKLKITGKLRKYDEDTIVVIATNFKDDEKLFRIDSIELAQSKRLDSED
jgi:hypothetical protein